MKKATNYRSIKMLLSLFVIFLASCSKETDKTDIATLVTTTASNIAQTTATAGGNITADGGASITARGLCWGPRPRQRLAEAKPPTVQEQELLPAV